MSLILANPLLTMGDLLDHLGVPARRVLLKPPPGKATEGDLLRCKRKGVELIDGVLVEKAMGWYESRLGYVFIFYLESFLREHDLGIGLGDQGLTRVAPGQLRMPDVAFYSWRHFPDRLLPEGQILNVAPDLAVEILSPGNTKKEMARKRREYFAAGVKLVWEAYPKKRQVAVYTAADVRILLDESQTLDGGAVLPGFTLKIGDWFARAGTRA